MTSRRCLACQRDLPVASFYASGHGSGRRRTCIRCLHAAVAVERRARGARERHLRINARGDVWCNRCRRYRGAEDFRRHPQRPNTWWAYCRECTREIDRTRYAKRTSTIEGATLELEKKQRRKDRLGRRRDRERRFFVAESISLLRRRGFTKAEIVRLADVSFPSLLDWERQARRVTPAVVSRFSVLVQETSDYRGGEPPVRRRLPHPDCAMLMERCRPLMLAHPVRSAWKNGRRS